MVGTACLAMFVPIASARAQYTFTKIAESATDFFGVPCINASGLVAFERTNGVSFTSGVYTGTGGPVTTIAGSATPGLSGIITHPSINDAGVVAFKAYRPDGTGGIYKGSGGAITLIDSVPSIDALTDARLSINNSGMVAYHKWDAAGTTGGIYTGDGTGAATPVAVAPGGTYSSLGTAGTLQMGNSGAVAFYAQLTGGGQGVFSSSGAAFQNGADSSIVSFNDVGRAVFTTIVGPLQTLLTGPAGGPSAVYLDNSGPYAGFVSASINNLNHLAFVASLDVGVSGIYAGPNPVSDKVIQAGDALFGSTVTNANLWSGGLSDNGDIAFSYGLLDGRQGIAVAHAVPAPGALAGLMGLGGLGLGRRRCEGVRRVRG